MVSCSSFLVSSSKAPGAAQVSRMSFISDSGLTTLMDMIWKSSSSSGFKACLMSLSRVSHKVVPFWRPRLAANRFKNTHVCLQKQCWAACCRRPTSSPTAHKVSLGGPTTPDLMNACKGDSHSQGSTTHSSTPVAMSTCTCSPEVPRPWREVGE